MEIIKEKTDDNKNFKFGYNKMELTDNKNLDIKKKKMNQKKI